MNIKSAKAKGRRCAQELRGLLLGYGTELTDDDIHVTPASVSGPDLWLSPAAKIQYPYEFECKNVEKLNIWKALEQAESHGENFLLVFRRNHSKLYVAQEFERWLIS